MGRCASSAGTIEEGVEMSCFARASRSSVRGRTYAALAAVTWHSARSHVSRCSRRSGRSRHVGAPGFVIAMGRTVGSGRCTWWSEARARAPVDRVGQGRLLRLSRSHKTAVLSGARNVAALADVLRRNIRLSARLRRTSVIRGDVPRPFDRGRSRPGSPSRRSCRKI
jgi:hypothetical protein